MKLHAQQQCKSQQSAQTLTGRLTERAVENRTLAAAPRTDADAGPGPHAPKTVFGHDLSLIPAHSGRRRAIQAKLALSAPGDAFEREADRISERVMSAPEKLSHHASERADGGRVWRGVRSLHGPLQVRRVESDDSRGIATPPVVEEVLRSSGRPLDSAARSFMEPRFGQDFGMVRVHTDARAALAASAVAARAFTTGRDIVFGAGEYAPQTERGRRLLSHELSHVMQQSAAAPQPHVAPYVLQRQHDPTKAATPARGTGLDTNPARGATDRMEMLAKQVAAANNRPRTKKEKLLALRQQLEAYAAYYEYFERVEKWILGALAAAEKSVTGNATQDRGASFFGMNTSSEGSTAAKPSKNVKYFNSSGGDLSEILEMGELLTIGVSKPHELFTTPEDFADKSAEVLFELRNKIKEINGVLEEEKQKEKQEKLKDSLAKKSELLRKTRALKKDVKAESDKLQAEAGKAQAGGAGQVSAASGQSVAASGQSVKVKQADSKQTKAVVTKPSTSKPPWYSSDPMGYWNSEGLYEKFESVSGDPAVPPGAIAVITDKKGVKRKFRYWVGEGGVPRSELLETINPTDVEP